MVHELKGVPTAKCLLVDTEIQSALVRLWKASRLDRILEAQVFKAEYISLLEPEETHAARLRLEKLGYRS